MKQIYSLLTLCAFAIPSFATAPLINASLKTKAPEKNATLKKAPAKIVENGWHSVGKGVWYEGFLTIFDEIDFDLSWEIDVEESDEVAGYYRFIPYNENSPVAEIVGAPDHEYFYLDASNPDKVYSEEFIAYRDFEFNYYFSQKVPENLWEEEMYGQLEDNVVYFPVRSFGYFEPETSTFWDVNYEGDFKIVLPGGVAKDNWRTIGESTFTDGFCAPYFNADNQSSPVTVQERDRRPGYYRLLGAFKQYGSESPLIIDATNPDFVTVPSQSAGFDHPQRGEVYVYSHCENFITPMKYETIEQYAEAYPQYVATMQDGIIKFPPDAIVLHFPDWNPLSFTTNDDLARESSVEIPNSGGSAVGSIQAVDANAQPVYYNLQGARVANPSAGIFIEVRGSQARKVILSK